jgi:AbrB family looped-hinge helix DNA binding protein
METTKISTKYQVVIPRKIREQFKIKPGQKVVFIPFEHTLQLVIVPPIEEARGLLKGIDTTVPRAEDERT